MDAPHPHAHQHGGRRGSEHALPVMLVFSFLVLSACAAFAVVMTNGPDGRASALPIPTPTLSGGTSMAVGGDVGDASTEPLGFTTSLPGGPVALGQPGRLVIAVSNPHERAIVLDDVNVSVGDPGVPGCRPEWLAIGAFDSEAAVTVPPHGTARVSLPYELVDLPGTNQDACKGAAFPLTISGSGRPV